MIDNWVGTKIDYYLKGKKTKVGPTHYGYYFAKTEAKDLSYMASQAIMTMFEFAIATDYFPVEDIVKELEKLKKIVAELRIDNAPGVKG